MSTTLPSAIDLDFKPDELEEIISKAKDWALMHGVCMRSKANFNPDVLQVSRQKFSRSLAVM